jgi:NarL family two-component system response regulator LiaR
VKKIRILVAEDHAIVREGTCRVLQQEPDFEVVAEAGDGEEAVKLATELKPDIVILDIVMPKLNGIEATRQIKKLCPETGVLILSAYDDEQFVIGLLQAGAAGYLLKSIHGRELVAAIRAMLQGEPVLHPSVMRRVLNHFIPDGYKSAPSGGLQSLTDREKEVLLLATKGFSNKDIAKELHLSIRTVQTYFTRMFKKLQVSSRTEAVLLGLKEGWLSIDDQREDKPVRQPGV